MKLTLTAIFIAISSSTLQINAASYTITNSAGSSLTNSVVNSTGGLITNGVALVGYYTSNRDASIAIATTTADILTGFVEFGNSSIATAANGIIGLFSVPAITPDLSAVGNTISGKNIYVIFGNAATFGTSNQAAVVKLSATYASSEPTTTSIAITGLPGSMILGGHNIFSGDPNPTNATTVTGVPFYSTTSIPEPSTAFLSVLGILGLTRRRRN